MDAKGSTLPDWLDGNNSYFMKLYLYILSMCFIGKVIYPPISLVKPRRITLFSFWNSGSRCRPQNISRYRKQACMVNLVDTIILVSYLFVRLNQMSSSLIIASFGKFLPILTIIWDYNMDSVVNSEMNTLLFKYKAHLVFLIVSLSQFQALRRMSSFASYAQS